MGTDVMNLVAFQDGDKYGEPITNSVVIAKVFGLRHDNVLRAIENLVSGTEEVVSEDWLLKIEEPIQDVGDILSVNSAGEIVDGDGHQRKIALMSQDEDERPVRVREHGRRAGQLITDPLYPPNEEELALEERKKLIAARQAAIANNSLNTEKFQFFRRAEYEGESGKGRVSKYPMYEMNEAGFSLLVMGFTGKKALMFKLLFVREFFRLKALTTKLLKQNSDAYLRIKDGDAMVHYSNELERYREQINTLKMEKRDMWEELQEANRKIAVMTEKGNGYLPAYRAIRKELIKDMAGTHFYVPIKAAEKIIKRARTYKTEDRLRSTIEHLGVLIDQSLDLGVDTLISNGTDPEAMFDEDTVLKYEKKLFGVTD